MLGVIEADGRAELEAALEQLAGGLSRPLGRLRSELLNLVAELEAGFDFPDEDLPFITPGDLDARLAEAGRQVQGSPPRWPPAARRRGGCGPC